MKQNLKTICEPITHVVKLNERKARIALILVIALLLQVIMPITTVQAFNDRNIEEVGPGELQLAQKQLAVRVIFKDDANLEKFYIVKYTTLTDDLKYIYYIDIPDILPNCTYAYVDFYNGGVIIDEITVNASNIVRIPTTFSAKGNICICVNGLPHSSYTVTFNSNGGSSVAQQEVSSGGNATEPSAPTRTGYTFKEWQLNGSKYDFNTEVTNDITLNAVWTANKYTVTFDKQNGTGGSNSVSATYDSAMPSATMPTRAGYTFGGYYTGTNGTGTQYYKANGTSAKNWDKTSNTKLYAKWTANTNTPYKVEYYLQNTDGTYNNVASSSDNKTGTTDTTATATAKSITGWTYNDSDERNVKSGKINGNGTLVLKLYYTINKYTVEFKDGVTGERIGNIYENTPYNTTINAPSAPEHEGYTFKAWSNGFTNTTKITGNLTNNNAVVAIYNYNIKINDEEKTVDTSMTLGDLRSVLGGNSIRILKDVNTDDNELLTSDSTLLNELGILPGTQLYVANDTTIKNMLQAYKDFDDNTLRTADTKQSLGNKIADINTYLEENSKILTSTEKQNLANIKENLQNGINVIDEVAGKLNIVRENNENIPALADINENNFETLDNLVKNIDALREANEANLTDTEKTELTSIREDLITKIKKIIEDKLDEFKTRNDTKILATIKSSDKNYLTSLKDEIETFAQKYNTYLSTTGENSDIDTINSLKDSIDEKITKINEVATETTRIVNLNKEKTITNVTSSDRADLVQLKADANSALTNWENNLTDDEKAALNKVVSDTTKEIARIDLVAKNFNTLKGRNDLLDIDNINTDDLSNLNALKADCMTFKKKYTNNLTDTEKAEYGELLKSVQEKIDLLNEINEIVADAPQANEKITLDNIKTSNYETLAELKDDIEEALSSNNLTEEQREILEQEYEGIKEKYDFIKEIVDTLDQMTNNEVNEITVNSVTADNEGALTSLKEQILAEQASDNMKYISNEDKQALVDLLNEVQDKLDKIEDVKENINSISEANEDITIGNVKTTDEEELIVAKEKAENLLNTNNLTEAQRTVITNALEEINDKLDKIETIKNEISELKEDYEDSKTLAVTDNSREELEDLKDEIEEYITENADNLTDAQKEELNAIIEDTESKLDTIQDVKDTIKDLTTRNNDLPIDSITKDDVEDLLELKSDINDAMNNYADNLTDAQKGALEDMLDSVEDKIYETKTPDEKIDYIEEENQGYNVDEITSEDKADLQELLDKLNAVKEELGDGITEKQQKAITDQINAIEDKIETIENVEQDVQEVLDTNENNVQTVKEADKEDLTTAKETAENLLKSDNLTEEQREEIQNTLEEINAKLDKIEKIETVLNTNTEDTLQTTVADKDDLETAKANAESLLNSNNLTEEQKEAIENTLEEINSKLDKIEKMETVINTSNEETAKTTADDKENLEAVKTTAENLLNSDNLTDEQKEEIRDAIADINTKLDKIEEVKENIDSVLNTNDDVTIENVETTDEEKLTQAKDTAENLLKSENLTEEQRQELTNTLEEINAKLDKIEAMNTPADYSKIDKLIAKIEGLDLENDYVATTVADLKDVLSNIDRTKNSLQQAEVDAMYEELNATFNSLKPVGTAKADNTENALGTTITNTPEELKKAIPFTEEEKEHMKTGVDARISLEVKVITATVTDEEKQLIKEKLGENEKVGIYLDINLFKQVGNNDQVKITETNEKITVTFEIPEELLNTADNITRTFYIVRIHDGIAEKIDAKVEDNKISFETDRFSTYALTYTDTVKAETSENTNPKTGDNIAVWLGLALISIVGIVGTRKFQEKN